MHDVARKVLASVKAMVPGRFEAVPATPDTHPHVKWKAYETAKRTAAANGFRHLGYFDVTSIEIDESMFRRPVLSMFLSQDGTEIVGHYRLSLRWTFMGLLAALFGGRGDILDIGTYIGGSDGVLFQTTTAKAAAAWQTPDFEHRETLKKGTPLPELVRVHRKRVREYRNEHPGVRPLVVRTAQEVLDVTHATEQRKLAFRRSLGWATRNELSKLGGLSGAAFEQFYAAFRELADSDGPRSLLQE